MAQGVAKPSDANVATTDKETAPILWFADVGAADVAIVGGKGANLGELTRKGAAVPPGFVVTVANYRRFVKQAGLQDKLRKLLARLNVNDSPTLTRTAEAVQKMILDAPMPRDLADQIIAAYEKMGDGAVAVRSSATAEDLPDASFAGQQRTFLNVTGAENVVQAVKGCWASLFEARAIFYRQERGYDQLAVGIAVVVQRMVQSQVSGVMFTVEPTTSNRNNLVIEAVYGLGEAFVSGEVTPDTYLVDKQTFRVLSRKVTPQTWKLVRNPSSLGADALNIKVAVPPAEVEHPKLNDEEVRELARYGLTLERAYDHPQDIEWAYEDSRFYIVQTRAVTTLRAPEKADGLTVDLAAHPLLLSGAGASPGSAYGPVKIIRDLAELGRVHKGDILVTGMTSPDFVPAMKRAAAIVTDHGGRTAHAAIVSRELGIPCVVGTGTATNLLRDGQIVTVDGATGKVYAGAVNGAQRAAAAETEPGASLKTRTKILVNLAEPDLADAIAKRNVDGVGLLRAEFIIARIGEHPRQMVLEGRGDEFVEKLRAGLEKFAAAFDPRPVIYRTSDFKTNEYRHLRGGDKFEPAEENPMIGYRGASRYINEPDLFALEIEAVKKVRQAHKNLYVMIPFVRTVEEMAQTKALLEECGLRRGEDGFKLWMMAEIPANVFLLDEFIDVGIDGISIGSNDLTQLVLGVDRDNAALAKQFDERNPAVLRALETLVTTAARRGVTCSICGQAPSFFPDLTAKLVEWGITSVSVSPDAINKTREIVHAIESQKEVAPS